MNRNLRLYRVLSTALAMSGLVGCARSGGPSANASRSGEQVDARQATLRANADKARQALVGGELHAGQSMEEFLAICTPYDVQFVDRFAFANFFELPNFYGLSLVFVDGKLARASDWDCTRSQVYFNTMTPQDEEAAGQAFESRIYNRQ